MVLLKNDRKGFKIQTNAFQDVFKKLLDVLNSTEADETIHYGWYM